VQNWAECGSGVECLLNTLGSILNTAEDKKENEGRKEGGKNKKESWAPPRPTEC
jgi:hypothetical protein